MKTFTEFTEQPLDEAEKNYSFGEFDLKILNWDMMVLKFTDDEGNDVYCKIDSEHTLNKLKQAINSLKFIKPKK